MNVEQGILNVEVWDVGVFEVEFVKEDATNYEYNGASTFTIKLEDIERVVWISKTK